MNAIVRRTRAAAVALALAVGFAGCQPADQGEEAAQDTTGQAAFQATLDSMRTAYEQAVADGDFDAQASLYTSDAVYSPPGMGPIQGRDSIRAVLEATTPPNATLDIRPLEVKRLGEDWFYEIGVGTFTFTPEGAEQERETSATYLVFFKRTPDGWRAHREVLSSNAPLPGGGQ